MRGPSKAFWQGRVVPGSFQLHRHPTRVTFLIVLDSPEKQKGRHIEVTFNHALLLSEFTVDTVEALKNYADSLPEEMG